MILELLIDPTVLLCIAFFLSPLYLKKDTVTRHEVSAYARSLVYDHHIQYLVAILVVIAVIGNVLRRFSLKKLAKKKEQQAKNRGLHAYQLINYPYLLRPLRYGERLRARWFLLSGVAIMGYGDALVGTLQLPSPLLSIYATMDRRYASPLHSYQGSLVHTQGVCQIFCIAPFSILLYFFFQLRHPFRDPLELVLCVLHCYTTVMYIGQEFMSGGRNLAMDYFFTFSPHYVVEFWFLVVFLRSVFIVIPLCLGFWSFQRISNQVMFYHRHHYPHYSFLDYQTIRKVVK